MSRTEKVTKIHDYSHPHLLCILVYSLRISLNQWQCITRCLSTYTVIAPQHFLHYPSESTYLRHSQTQHATETTFFSLSSPMVLPTLNEYSPLYYAPGHEDADAQGRMKRTRCSRFRCCYYCHLFRRCIYRTLIFSQSSLNCLLGRLHCSPHTLAFF